MLNKSLNGFKKDRTIENIKSLRADLNIFYQRRIRIENEIFYRGKEKRIYDFLFAKKFS
ncbi:hypothetical protein OENI_500001 [Oenococcus oeni]|nr:hypothetical protein OENI_500001 [Oenococcus oeni]